MNDWSQQIALRTHHDHVILVQLVHSYIVLYYLTLVLVVPSWVYYHLAWVRVNGSVNHSPAGSLTQRDDKQGKANEIEEAIWSVGCGKAAKILGLIHTVIKK